jgi:hypothetical protein
MMMKAISMSNLNTDMQAAVDSLGLNEADKALLEKILYLERVNKTKEWSSDAVKQIRDLVNESDSGTLDD